MDLYIIRQLSLMRLIVGLVYFTPIRLTRISFSALHMLKDLALALQIFENIPTRKMSKTDEICRSESHAHHFDHHHSRAKLTQSASLSRCEYLSHNHLLDGQSENTPYCSLIRALAFAAVAASLFRRLNKCSMIPLLDLMC